MEINIINKEQENELSKYAPNTCVIRPMKNNPYIIELLFKYNPILFNNLIEIPSFNYNKKTFTTSIHYLDLDITLNMFKIHGIDTYISMESNEILSKLKETILNRLKLKKEPLIEFNEKRTFKPYQIIGSQFLYKSQNALNADCVGSGKTTQSIGAVLLHVYDNKPHNTLVVCPSSVKGAWYKEVKSITDRLKPIIMDSNINKRYDQYQTIKDYDFLIMSYDSLLKDYTIMSQYFRPNILIIDEAQRLCNKSNRITQILIGGKNVKKTFRSYVRYDSVYLLSGTPITNKLEDIYPILKVLDPELFSWQNFIKRYTKYREFEKILKDTGISYKFKKIIGYKNQNELKNKVNIYMIRRLKDEILNDLPDKTYKILNIELSNEERKFYDELKENMKAEFENKVFTINDRLVWMTRAQQICNSLETYPGVDSTKSSKLDELKKLVEDLHEEHKIVIFSKYTSVTNILERELKQYNPLHIKGDVKDSERTSIIKKFQEDPKYRVILLTYGAGGTGITLTSADICILYDLAWTPSSNAQAIGRLDRIGQKNNINVYILKVEDSVEEKIFDIIWNKQNIIDNILEDEKSTLAKFLEKDIKDLI